MQLKLKYCLFLTVFAILIFSSFPSFCFCDSTVLKGWQVADCGGLVSESNGVVTLSGDEKSAGPLLYKEISPQSDFEISLQIKAATLGEVSRDPDGAGEGFSLMLRPENDFSTPFGINFEMRGRGGGQFVFAQRDISPEVVLFGYSGKPWQWVPFIYNTREYNDGYDYWHNYPSYLTDNALVKPNTWYTMKLYVQEQPFVIAVTVLTEAGKLLGTISTSDIPDFPFQEMKFVGISSGFGGEFDIRDVSFKSSSEIDTYEPAYTSNITNENNQGNLALKKSVEIETVPEFPSWIILPLFLIATVTVALYRKKFWKEPI